VAESGFKDYAIATWFGLSGRRKCRRNWSRIQRDTAKVFNQAATKEKLTGLGVELILNSPEEFRDYLKGEIVRYTRVIKDAGIKAQ